MLIHSPFQPPKIDFKDIVIITLSTFYYKEVRIYV
nr:MAG TPA: hypothetical protein [Myoviridae sp. ctNPX13]